MNTRVLRQLLGKLGGLLLTLFLASVLIFSAMLLTPGDPVFTIAGSVRPTPEMIAAIQEQYHLDQPVWVQYLSWIGGVFSGDLGTSFVYKTPVAELIAPRIGITALLVLYTLVLIVVFGLGSGILAATRGRAVDRTVLVTTSFGMALPTFVVAILLIWIFGRVLGWFPVYGAGSGLLDNLYHLTLPAISLAVLYIAYISRITRGAIVGQQHAEHVETALVRGIPRVAHLPPACLPERVAADPLGLGRHGRRALRGLGDRRTGVRHRRTGVAADRSSGAQGRAGRPGDIAAARDRVRRAQCSRRRGDRCDRSRLRPSRGVSHERRPARRWACSPARPPCRRA